MNKCFVCSTTESIVHSGVDALLLECLDSIGQICYSCANSNLKIRQEARSVKL